MLSEAIAAGDSEGMQVRRWCGIMMGLAALAPIASGEPLFAGFSDPAMISTGRMPYGVTTADLNSDGFLDILVGTISEKEIALIFGRGDGTFDEPVMIPAMGGVFEVAVGDLDNDGDLDFVAPHTGAPGPAGVSVYLNDGFGAFTYSATYPSGPSPTDAALADFNGDGALDIVATSQVGSSAYVIIGIGDGSFQPTTNLSVGNVPIDVATADLNNDGTTDFITANGFSDDLTIWWNQKGSFGANEVIVIDRTPHAVACIDIDADLDVDLVIATAGSPAGGLMIMENTNGQFEPSPVLSVGAGNSSGVVVSADFNNDGLSDLLSTDFGAPAFAVFLHDQEGAYVHSGLFDAPITPYGAAEADFDGDGDRDLVMTGGAEHLVAIYFNQTFGPTPKAADLNNDGVVNGQDLATLLATWGSDGPGDLNNSGMTNGADLVLMLTAWGEINR